MLDLSGLFFRIGIVQVSTEHCDPEITSNIYVSLVLPRTFCLLFDELFAILVWYQMNLNQR